MMGIMIRTLPIMLAVSLLATAPAAAQPAVPAVTTAAQPHLESALRHYKAREYARALVEFRAAYNIDPQPALLYAIAQAERLNGDCRRAIRFYEAYLRTAPKQSQVLSARQNIARCTAELQRPAPATQPATAPSSAPTDRPEPALVAAPVSPRVPGSHGSSWTRDWVGHGLVLGGLAVAATGIAVWRIGRGTIADANAARDYDTFAARAGGASRAELEQKVGIAAMAVGGALVAAGVAHYVLRGRGRAERARVEAAVGPGRAVLVLGGRF
jgi:tetratricopeptide (TPR) repeat protein